MIGSYAIIYDRSGIRHFQFVTRKQIDIIKKKSKIQDIWRDYEDRKAVTTAIRSCCRKAGLFQDAVYQLSEEGLLDSDDISASVEFMQNEEAAVDITPPKTQEQEAETETSSQDDDIEEKEEQKEDKKDEPKTKTTPNPDAQKKLEEAFD